MVDSPTTERGAPRERAFGHAEPRPSVAPGTQSTNGVAVLAVSDSGAILSNDDRFAELLRVPRRIASTRSVRTLVTWLEQEGDVEGAGVAEVLECADADCGEVSTGDDRVIAWSRTRLVSGECGWLYAFREVGRDRAAARALRDAENWLHMFAAHTGGAIIELDAAGRVVGTWSADAEILSMPEASLQGRTLWDALGGAQAPELEKVVRGVLDTGEAAHVECTLDAAGQRKVFAIDISELSNETSGPVVVSLFVRDVTEHTRTQTQLVQAERLASVGLLAAGVAHEINNPLTYMAINFQRVRRGIRSLGEGSLDAQHATLARELEDCVAMMIEGAQRVQEIVRDLQSFSRTDQNDARELVDVRNALELTLGLVSFEIERHARVIRDFGDVPLVLASEGRLRQVFLNLIRNAVQSLPDPAPARHEIRVATSTNARGNAVIEVRDTGCGISRSDLGRIFDPFFTTKAPNVGTGLGLAICHEIVRSLGGQITVESEVGVGTVFRVVLPAASVRR